MSRPAPTLNPPDEVARLCAEYLPLARRMARPFQRACWDYQRDDFESAAYYGLFLAATTWDRDRSEFAGHAMRRIRYKLRETWKRLGRRWRPALELLEGDASYEHDPEGALEPIDLQSQLGQLDTQAQRIAMAAARQAGWKRQTIAQAFGVYGRYVSRAEIRYRMDKAVRPVRERIEAMGGRPE